MNNEGLKIIGKWIKSIVIHYMKEYLVAVIAFGAKSTENITQVLIGLNINYQILLPWENPDFEPTHVILSGGSKHVYETDHDPIPKWILDSKVPVLGICYGMQLIAKTFGGIVKRMPVKEKGPINVTEFIDGNQQVHICQMNRHDQVVIMPESFYITGVTDKNHIASCTDKKKWWGVQYHPESQKYRDTKVFERFLKNT